MYIPTNQYYGFFNTVQYLILGTAFVAYILWRIDKKKRYRVLGSVCFLCALLFAVSFHLQDFMYVFRTQGMVFDGNLFFQYSGSLLIGIGLMIVFDIVFLLMANTQMQKKLLKCLWFAVCLVLSICFLYFFWNFNRIPNVEIQLMLYLISSLKEFYIFPLIYFFYIEADYLELVKHWYKKTE